MSWGTWNPPTYRDVVGNDLPVACPQCKRPCAPDMLHPTADFPSELLSRFRRSTVSYLCDSCRATLIREERITPADMTRLLGAPETYASRIEAKQGERGARGRLATAIAARDARRGNRGA